jgi:hypothetical protein
MTKAKQLTLPLKTILLTLILLKNDCYLFAQHYPTVSGTVHDARTGETLIGATVFLHPADSQAHAGDFSALTNGYGFFSLSAPKGRYRLMVSFQGYETDTQHLSLISNVSQRIQLSTTEQNLKEITVIGVKDPSKALMGVQQLSTKDISKIPVLFGESDILKSIQLLPGVQTSGDVSNGFYVRGGGADQNLILLDEAPIYNAYHLLGFFSTFNTDAIKGVTLYKGEMPAQYGGRLSSVLDVTMNDGDNQHFKVSGGIGLIASRLSLQGPIKKGKGSFLISARRTYADIFLPLSGDSTVRNSHIYFYDVNLKANYAFDDKTIVYLSGYAGKDALNLDNQLGVNWGNATGTLRVNHVFSSRLFSNSSLIFSHYGYTVLLSDATSQLTVSSKINDIHGKEDLQWFVAPGQQIHLGAELIRHDISPGILSTSENSSYNPLALPQKFSWESALYASHQWAITSTTSLIYGLRISMFNVMGPGTFYSYTEEGQPVDPKHYPSTQIVTSYINPEPRISLSQQLSTVSTIKISYARNAQNLHLLTNSTTNNPTDIWIPSSNNVKPEIADQVSLGYYLHLGEGKYEASTEVYYKALQNQIDYKNGAQLEGNVNVESQLLFGIGRAYGVEWFLKKKTGNLTGWISYSLSRTERQFSQINEGTWFPANQDHTHDLSVVGLYKLSKKWTLSSDFVYVSGSPATWPIGKYSMDGHVTMLYGQRNGSRMPPYDRLDVGATYLAHTKGRYSSSWTFSVFNVYNRENPYTINFQTDPNNPAKTQAIQTSLFKIIPSVTYNFSF